MIKLRQAVIVEGKYDKAKLSSLIDAVIVTTDGFDVFRNRDKLKFIRSLAEKNGIIILTDSDAAGFRIRSYLAGAIPADRITHVYIPDVVGKERRKSTPSAEGKLGVEGISPGLLLEAFARAGVTPLCASGAETAINSDAGADESALIDKSDLVAWGISGGQDSAEKRRRLLHSLGMPARMNSSALLKALNSLYTRDDIMRRIEKL